MQQEIETLFVYCVLVLFVISRSVTTGLFVCRFVHQYLNMYQLYWLARSKSIFSNFLSLTGEMFSTFLCRT